MADSSSGKKEFDMVVFGATGFTGEYMVREMLETCGTSRHWAIAGRTRSKLNALHQKLNLPGSVGLIQANVEEEQSIRDMCKRANLLINCVGPYGVYSGDMVIRLCIEEGSDYIDLTGEIDYLELMRDKYSKLAEEKGVFVVPGCGFFSLVIELAVNCALQTMTSSELSCVNYYQIPINSGGIHTGTWHSILESISKFRTIGKKIARMERLQASPLRQATRWPLHYESRFKSWFLSKATSNSHFLRLSMSDIGKRNGKGEPSLAVTENFSFGSFIITISLMIMLMMIFIPAQFSPIRKFLVTLVRGPSHASIKKASFQCVVDTTISGAEGESKNVRVNISGAEMGYVATSCICVSSAITILEEKDIIQSSTKRKGGVFTPGFVFEKTTLVERLNKSQKVLFETKEV